MCGDLLWSAHCACVSSQAYSALHFTSTDISPRKRLYISLQVNCYNYCKIGVYSASYHEIIMRMLVIMRGLLNWVYCHSCTGLNYNFVFW